MRSMLGRFKSAVYNAIGGIEEEGVINGIKHQSPTHTRFAGKDEGHEFLHEFHCSKPSREKYKYQRPHFLKLETEDEIQVTADHSVRPIIVPR